MKNSWKWFDWLLIGAVLGGFCAVARADTLQWQTPVGLINLNLTTTEALLGYDGILRQAVGGASLPVYTDPKGIVALQLGAIAPWPVGNQATIQPYIALGHDIAREIPGLSQFQSIHLNAFGRYDPGLGKAGAGISFSYSFAESPTPAPSN